MPRLKEKRPPGRPLKLNHDLIAKISEAIRAGAYIETAAAYCGIDKETFFKWLKKGARHQGRLHTALNNSIRRALAESELSDVVNISRAAQGVPAKYDDNHNLLHSEMRPDWKASAWRLERKFRKRWGTNTAVELTGKDGGPIETDDNSLGRSERIALLMGVLNKVKGGNES